MRPRRPLSGGAIVWLVVGVIVAGGHHFFDNLATLSHFLSAVLAVVLWPVVLFNIEVRI